MTEQQQRKQHIRAFMQAHYTDERLAMLLAHARDGKLSYISCCCFIGIANADHALRGRSDEGGSHLRDARMYPGAIAAEGSFLHLWAYAAHLAANPKPEEAHA